MEKERWNLLIAPVELFVIWVIIVDLVSSRLILLDLAKTLETKKLVKEWEQPVR